MHEEDERYLLFGRIIIYYRSTTIVVGGKTMKTDANQRT